MQLWLTKNSTQIRRAECYVNFNTIFECGFHVGVEVGFGVSIRRKKSNFIKQFNRIIKVKTR